MHWQIDVPAIRPETARDMVEKLFTSIIRVVGRYLFGWRGVFLQSCGL